MPALVFAPPSWTDEFLVTKLEIEHARRRASRMAIRCRQRRGQPYPYKSWLRGKGMLAGLIGEEILKTRYDDFELSKDKETFNYDLLHPKLERVEVKTKRCSSPPQMGYFCSVPETSLHQQCDYFAFMRLHNDYTRAWFIGMIPRDDFFEMAIRFKRGDRDPTAGKDSFFRFSATCYNVTVKQVLKHPCNKKKHLVPLDLIA